MLKLLLGFVLGVSVTTQYPDFLPARLIPAMQSMVARLGPGAAQEGLPATDRPRESAGERPVGKTDAHASPLPPVPPPADGSPDERKALSSAQWAEVHSAVEKARAGKP